MTGMEEAFAAKGELRARMRRTLAGLSPERLRLMSAPIVERLLAHPRVAGAGTVLAYHSLPGEVRTHEMLGRLLGMGKAVLLPRVPEAGGLVLVPYAGRESLRPGAFGIMEPVGEAVPCHCGIDVAIVPALAYDGLGNRLGRGKGYYDSLLAGMPATYKIGVCFPFQIVERVPTTEGDVRVDEVLH